MAPDPIPTHVHELIVRHIESVQQVEILALLHGEPERDWTPPQVSRSLQIAVDTCAHWMDAFAAAGLCPRGTRAAAAADLVALFARRRLAVIDAIHGAR